MQWIAHAMNVCRIVSYEDAHREQESFRHKSERWL